MNISFLPHNATNYTKEIISQIYTQNEPMGLCIYLNYDLWVAMNIFLPFLYVINMMFRLTERDFFKEIKIDTETTNFCIIMILFVVNVYFFIIHFLMETIIKIFI